MATRSLSPKQIAERTQLHRQAVMLFARLAAKNAVKDEMRAQGIRMTLVLPAIIAEKSKGISRHASRALSASVRAGEAPGLRRSACRYQH